MREHAHGLDQVCDTRQPARGLRDLCWFEAVARQAGIDFDVNASPASERAGCPRDRVDLIETRQPDVEVEMDGFSEGLAGAVEPAEHGSADALIP